jgi:acetoacetyl-CoA synthetase
VSVWTAEELAEIQLRKSRKPGNMANPGIPPICWSPPPGRITPMDRYREHVNSKFHQNLKTTKQLQKWSCDKPQDFWVDLYGYLGLQPPLPRGMKRAYDDSVPMSSNPPFFPGHMINYTENAIFSNPDPNATALIGIREGMNIYNDPPEILTWGQFREKVRVVSSALRRSGIKKGDRVGALVATSNWAVILLHAVAAVGAIFTSISPELGLEGCVSRLQQVTPRILFVDSHAVYKAKAVSTKEKLEGILERLRPKPEVFVIPTVAADEAEVSSRPSMQTYLARARDEDPLTFTRVPFSYPLLIVYSSGTTGAPKCIVHQHGLIIQLRKISTLHNGLTHKDVVMQYSSTSWVVFNVQCGHFAVGAALVVYNGSPLYPDAKVLMRICEKFKVTFLGASPRLLLEIEMSKTIPKKEFDLDALRIVYTTGATLSLAQYHWFYNSMPSKVHICNTAGGTDTATSLIALDPSAQVHEGEMQIAALGMDVDVADPVSGESIAHTGEAGEMIVRKPFPSMPCFFWGDEGNVKYKEAYFQRFEDIDVWAQHDWLSQNPRTGGYQMHGRSDGVLSKCQCLLPLIHGRFHCLGLSPVLASVILNFQVGTQGLIDGLDPSGIRFGSSEIYSLIEVPPFTTTYGITNTLCVGRRRPQDTDEAVFLFLLFRPGYHLTPSLRQKIKDKIRSALSARHVPKFVVQVDDFPVTINGKKVEIAVKQVLGGKEVKLSSTVSNPGSIEVFRGFRGMEREPVLREGKL